MFKSYADFLIEHCLLLLNLEGSFLFRKQALFGIYDLQIILSSVYFNFD